MSKNKFKFFNPKSEPIETPKSPEPENIIPELKEESETPSENVFPTLPTEDIGDKLKLYLETEGRFLMPVESYWSNYTAKHVTSFNLANEETILPTTLQVVDDLHSEKDYTIMNALPEEFTEVLRGIRVKFWGKMHEHKYMCTCQRGEEKPQASKIVLDLTEVELTSVSEATEKYKKYFEGVLNNLPQEIIQLYSEAYLKRKDGSISDIVSKLNISDKFMLNDPKIGKIEMCRNKMFHFVEAERKAQNVFVQKIRDVKKMKRKDSEKLSDFKEAQNFKLENLKKERGELALNMARALTIKTVNGKELSNSDEKLKIYKEIDATVLNQLDTIYDNTQFGITDERDIVCDLCHEEHRRSLRRSILPFEFLPTAINSSSKVRSQELPQSIVYIG